MRLNSHSRLQCAVLWMLKCLLLQRRSVHTLHNTCMSNCPHWQPRCCNPSVGPAELGFLRDSKGQKASRAQRAAGRHRSAPQGGLEQSSRATGWPGTRKPEHCKCSSADLGVGCHCLRSRQPLTASVEGVCMQLLVAPCLPCGVNATSLCLQWGFQGLAAILLFSLSTGMQDTRHYCWPCLMSIFTLQPGHSLSVLPAGSTAQAGSGRSGHAEAAVLPDSEEQRLSGAIKTLTLAF